MSTYKECLKNHAIGVGGYAIDGCAEFMPADKDDTVDAFKCAACNCHRNFHRKVTQTTVHQALPLTSRGGRYRDDQELNLCNPNSNINGTLLKKRFRTKFSQEHKDKMLTLAENIRWKIQRQDEGVVQQLCNETGIKRHVFKVWMHNNKHTLGKKSLNSSTTNP